MKIYNIFQPNLLQNTLIDLLINQVNELVLLVIINNEKKWEIEDIFNVKNY